MKIFMIAFFLIGCLSFPLNISQAENDNGCLCIASEVVQKYCAAENAGVKKDEYRINQEAIARRDIQQLLNQIVSAGIAKDAAALRDIDADEFTFKALDGKILTNEAAKNVGANTSNFQGILRVSDDTSIKIECLTFKGKDAVIYINQHYVRYVPDRKDESPHEVITNIIHREIWTFTEQGWKRKYVEELERGNTYLDGKLYNPG